MAKKKVIQHMGMTVTEQEHRKWHREHEGKDLTPQEHRKLMERLGISEKQDRQWHKAQGGSPGKPVEPGPEARKVNCFAIGGGFMDYCVKQGWLIRQGRGKAMNYYVTETGRAALAEYGITKY